MGDPTQERGSSTVVASLAIRARFKLGALEGVAFRPTLVIQLAVFSLRAGVPTAEEPFWNMQGEEQLT